MEKKQPPPHSKQMFYLGVNLQAAGQKGRVRTKPKVLNCMSKKSCPILYKDLLYKFAIGQNFFDIQYAHHNKKKHF